MQFSLSCKKNKRVLQLLTKFRVITMILIRGMSNMMIYHRNLRKAADISRKIMQFFWTSFRKMGTLMVFETQLDGFSLLVQNERGFLQFLSRTVGMTSKCACSACLLFFALLSQTWSNANKASKPWFRAVESATNTKKNRKTEKLQLKKTEKKRKPHDSLHPTNTRRKSNPWRKTIFFAKTRH